MQKEQNIEELPTANWLKFLLPSGIGIVFFLTPLSIDGQITVGMAWFGDLFIDNGQTQLQWMAGTFTVISVLLTLIFQVSEPARVRFYWLAEGLTLYSVWFLLRLFGCVAAFCYLFQIGPGWLIGGATAGTTLGSLIPITMTYMAIATVFLPLLVEFGLMEMVGVLLSKAFDKLFRLPGRSAIDALASWMGSGPVGVLITLQQYERGYYTAREAATICTNFSVVSVSFALVVANAIGMGDYFLPMYACVIGIGFVCALITPKLPPLSRLKDEFCPGVEPQGLRDFSNYQSLWSAAVHEALARAGRAPTLGELIPRIGRGIAEVWLSLIPVVMGLGTAALILAEYTPLFNWLGLPLIAVLNLFGLAEADAAAPLMFVGFTDMFLPALVGGSIESELTRFVVATVSVCQLIYMSEVGALIIKSKIPLGFFHIGGIFLIRTAISLPLAALIGHALF